MSRRAELYYEFGSFRIDPAEHLLLRDGQPISLTPKAFDTLLLLVQNSGHLMGKEELMKSLWPDAFVEEANLANNISLLRRLLGKSPEGERFIETHPKRGYRFVARVREVRHESAEPFNDALEPSVAGRDVRSIAVLPLESLCRDGSDEFLGLGLTDVLITRLSNMGGIIVRPTSAVRKYAESKPDPAVAGRELRVEAVLEGSIRRLGDRLRVTVQLVSVRDGVSLWAEKFDEKYEDIFTVEDAISEQIAKAFALRLSREQERVLKKRHTESTEAYRSYLKGRYHWHKWTHEGFKKAIEHFQQSVEKDPLYAVAYAGLADSYGLLWLQGFLSAKEAMPKAESSVMKALEIDEQLAEAHISLAGVKCWYGWDFATAEREFKRALEINLNYPTAHQAYALYLAAMGRLDEAHREIKKAQELDPFSLVLNATESYVLYYAGQYDRAIEVALNTIELDANFYPAYERLGDAYEQKAKYAEAIEAFQKATSLSERSLFPLAELGYTYAKANRRNEALGVIEELKERLNREYLMAWVYAGLGEKDQAFKWLEKASVEHDPSMVYLKIDPKLASLRSDTRFADLLHCVRLGPPTATRRA